MDNAMVCLLLVQVVSGGWVQPRKSPWSQLPLIEAMCPGQNVCPEDRSLNASDVNSDIVNCCAECSCDPACSSQGNCCFQRMDEIRDRSDQECLNAAVFPPKVTAEPFKSYYMVAKEPKLGCVANFQFNSASSESCCEAEVAPWGSLLPVWSPSKARIYKNRVYAECHGVNDSILWDVLHICPVVKELDADLDGCTIYFTFSGGKEEIQIEQCFTKKYATCPEVFHVLPRAPNLTEQEVREGCESDFRAAFGVLNHFKNVYCFMCTDIPYQLPRNCSNPLNNNRGPFGEHKITSLLSIEYLTGYMPHQNKVPDKACKMADGKVVVETCRPVHCPTGRIFSTVDGSCIFASRSLNIGELVVSVHLTFDNPNETLTYGAVQDLVKSGLRITFPNQWFIEEAYIPLADRISLTADWEDYLLKPILQNSLQRPAKELLLVLYPKHSNGDPAKLMETIQSNLLNKWTIRCGDLLLKASARLSNVQFASYYYISRIGKIFVPLSMRAHDSTRRKVFNESDAFFQIVHPSRVELSTDVISKLFFCRQIELQSHEFVLYNDIDPWGLLLVNDNKYFGIGEFRLTKTGRKRTARVCLRDAGYHLYHYTATAHQLQAYADNAWIVLLTTLICTS